MSSPPVLPHWVCANGPSRLRSICARTISAGFLVLATSVPFLALTPRAAAQFPIRQLHQSPLQQGQGFFARPVSGPAKRADQAAAATAPHPAVARITVIEKDGISYGSGTLVDSRGQFGLVVTNWHVIRDAAGQITVEFPDGFKSPAQVAKSDKDWDLAALSIYRPNATPVPVTATAPQKGEPLTIAGYGSGDYRLASGNCTQYLAPGVEFPYEMVELAAEARQGDSGGPIFNQQGQLAGVLFGSGPGYTSGSYGGRVLQFLATVVPGGVPGSDGAPPTAAIASNGSNAGHDLGLILGPPPQATALHQPVAPAPSAPPDPWKPPANQLPSGIAALTPAAPALPGNLLAPPSRDALSQRFDDVPLGESDVDPKAAVNLDRLAANTPLGDNTLTPRDDEENPTNSGNLLHVPLTPRAGTSVEAATDINSAPPDQLLAAAWKKIGGPSVLDQTKTVLAGIGVLSVLLLFWRMSRRSEREMDAD